MRRTFLIAFSLILALLAVGNVFAAGSAKSTADQPVTLRLSFWFDSGDLGYWQKGIDQFTSSHPNVKIVVEGTPWGRYWDKYATQVASDSQADITGMVSMYSQYYIKKGALLNLTPYIKRDNFDIKDYWPAVMQAYSDKAGIYALPYDLSTMLLIANMDLFAKAGIAYPTKAWTQNEFLVAAKKLTTMDSSGNPLQYAVHFSPTDWTFYDVMQKAGFKVIDKDNKLLLNQPGPVALVQWLADLNLKNHVAPTPSKTLDAESLFMSGKIAMDNVNPEWVMKIKENMPDAKLDVIPQPFSRLNGVVEGGSWAISSNTNNKDAAWEFLSFYTGKENLAYCVADAHRGIPGRMSLGTRMLSSTNAVPHSQLFLDAVKDAQHLDFPNRTEFEAIMSQYLDKVYSGDMTAQAAMDRLVKEGNDIINQK